MDTLKVACPHCGSIDAFTKLEAKLSFASLLGETCALCGHEVSFADVKEMRDRLADAISANKATVAISAHSLRHFSANAVSRTRGRYSPGL